MFLASSNSFILYMSQETPSVEEKTSSPYLPTPAAPPKPARPSKPRPKSRISRYRSSSSQRARRQRQALAQQAAAAAAAAAAMATVPSSSEHGAALDEDGSQGPYGGEHGHGENSLGGHILDGDGQGLNCINRGNLRYPKTKKVSGNWTRNMMRYCDVVESHCPNRTCVLLYVLCNGTVSRDRVAE